MPRSSGHSTRKKSQSLFFSILSLVESFHYAEFPVSFSSSPCGEKNGGEGNNPSPPDCGYLLTNAKISPPTLSSLCASSPFSCLNLSFQDFVLAAKVIRRTTLKKSETTNQDMVQEISLQTVRGCDSLKLVPMSGSYHGWPGENDFNGPTGRA